MYIAINGVFAAGTEELEEEFEELEPLEAESIEGRGREFEERIGREEESEAPEGNEAMRMS